MTAASIQPSIEKSARTSPIQTFRACYSEVPDSRFFSRFEERFRVFEKMKADDEPARKAALDATLGATEVELQNRRVLDLQIRERFAQILHEAYSTAAMNAPVSFLRSLPPQDLEVVRQAQSLAEPIDVKSLSLEGAYNLLLPGGFKVDFNRDGLSEIGVCKTAFFPPADAPETFRIAWLQATESMSETDVMVHGLSLWSSLYRDQLVTPGEERFAVVRSDLVSTYVSLLEERLRANEAFRAFLAPGQYERDRAFYRRLQELIGQNAVLAGTV